MNRIVLAALVFLAFTTGSCRPRSSSQPKYGSYLGHGYQIDVEIRDDLQHSISGKSTDDGAGKEVEQIEIRTGDVALVVFNGKVSVNSEPRGTVKSGDRMKVMLDGKLYVNDVERGKE